MNRIRSASSFLTVNNISRNDSIGCCYGPEDKPQTIISWYVSTTHKMRYFIKLDPGQQILYKTSYPNVLLTKNSRQLLRMVFAVTSQSKLKTIQWGYWNKKYAFNLNFKLLWIYHFYNNEYYWRLTTKFHYYKSYQKIIKNHNLLHLSLLNKIYFLFHYWYFFESI